MKSKIFAKQNQCDIMNTLINLAVSTQSSNGFPARLAFTRLGICFLKNMRQCSKCFAFKNEDEFKLYSYNRCYACIREQNRLFIQKNKEIVSERRKKYRELRKTDLRQFLIFLHSIMRERVANKNNQHPAYEGLPICFRDDFIAFGIDNKNLQNLYKQWQESNYEYFLTPSVDRVDNSKGYTLDNIQFITTIENIKKK